MKPIIKLFFIALFITGLTSCAKKKLTNNSWIVAEYKEDGENRTGEFHLLLPNYTIEFKGDGDFVATAQPLGITVTQTGSWSFEDSGKKLKLVYQAPDEGTHIWDCHKLTSDELQVSRQADKKEEFFFVAK